jgi:hypothetical protein
MQANPTNGKEFRPVLGETIRTMWSIGSTIPPPLPPSVPHLDFLSLTGKEGNGILAAVPGGLVPHLGTWLIDRADTHSDANNNFLVKTATTTVELSPDHLFVRSDLSRFPRAPDIPDKGFLSIYFFNLTFKKIKCVCVIFSKKKGNISQNCSRIL